MSGMLCIRRRHRLQLPEQQQQQQGITGEGHPLPSLTALGALMTITSTQAGQVARGGEMATTSSSSSTVV
jgi:hypothetical protein